MFTYVTEADMKAQRDAMMEQFMRSVEEAGRKSEAREAWKKAHPPCPHCGHTKPLPFHLTY